MSSSRDNRPKQQMLVLCGVSQIAALRFINDLVSRLVLTQAFLSSIAVGRKRQIYLCVYCLEICLESTKNSLTARLCLAPSLISSLFFSFSRQSVRFCLSSEIIRSCCESHLESELNLSSLMHLHRNSFDAIRTNWERDLKSKLWLGKLWLQERASLSM